MRGLAAAPLLFIVILTLGADTPRRLSGRVVDFDSPPGKPKGIDEVEVKAWDRARSYLLDEATTDGDGGYTLLKIGVGDDVLIEHHKEYYYNDPEKWVGVITEPKIIVHMSRDVAQAAYYVGVGTRLAERVKTSSATAYNAASLDLEWKTFRKFAYAPERREIVREQVGKVLGEAALRQLIVTDAMITAREARNKDSQMATEIARREGFAPDIYFPFDEAMLSADSKEALRASAHFLRVSPDFSLTIEGHADSIGISEYNMALAERRADNVREFLADEGIDPARLRTISYGEERSVCTEDDETCQAQNRRVGLAVASARARGYRGRLR
jgi:outer membrane protein OmpA-like peptidoglycan-associated protein